MMMGVPALKPVIGEVAPNSIASEAGLTPQMELTAVSGVQTSTWESVNLQFIAHIGDPQMEITAKPDPLSSYTRDFQLDLSTWSFDPETQSSLKTLGMTPYMPEITNEIAMIGEGSAAEKAQLQLGDQLQSIQGQKIEAWEDAVTLIKNNPNVPLEMEVLRDGEVVRLQLTPDQREQEGQLTGFAGVAPKVEPWPESYQFIQQYGPFAAIPAAFEKTWQLVKLTVSMVKKLLTGDLAVKNLSGPISIAKGAGMTADFGLVYFLSFLALISVNLGIMNLFPLPVLDGGHLVFFMIEAVTRRPVSERFLKRWPIDWVQPLSWY